MQKHIQHNKGERRHFFWKICLSLYLKVSKGLLKVLLRERWVGDWTELQHIDPHSYGHNSVSFSFSWAAQPGAWGPSLSGTWSSFQHLLSNSSELQLLNRESWGPPLLGAGSPYSNLSPTNSNFLCTELYYCFTSTQFNLSTVKVIPFYLRPDAPVIYTGAFSILTARPGSVCNKWRKKDGFMPFPGALAWNETRYVSSRI